MPHLVEIEGEDENVEVTRQTIQKNPLELIICNNYYIEGNFFDSSYLKS